MTTFDQLGLRPEILRVLDDLNFETPTTIQAEAIPKLINSRQDCIGLAQTGTGKTAAFGLPLLENINPDKRGVQALVLAPTRELGRQIADQLYIFSKYMKDLKVVAVYGGADINKQIKQIKKGPQIVIATPGRLIDLVKRRAINLEHIEQVVLDEADEMLNMGFKEDIDFILKHCAKDNNTWLFSATLPKEMVRLVEGYMTNPIRFKAGAINETNANIEHKFAIIKKSNRAEGLARFLDLYPNVKGVAFCRTRRDTQEVADYLSGRDYKADAIHGDLSQPQRDRVMNKFRNQEIQILVATDVAARGIDVDDLTHVFHLAMPDDVAYYTHRSGRTGRAGKQGESIAFIGKNDRGMLNAFERKLNITFEKVYVPQAEDILRYRMLNWGRLIEQTKVKNHQANPVAREVEQMLEKLPKDQLIAKLISHQLQQYESLAAKDLNESFNSSSKRKKRKGRRSYNNQKGYSGSRKKGRKRRRRN